MVGSPLRKEKTRIIKAYIVFRTSPDLTATSDHEDGQQDRILTLQKITSKRSNSSSNKPEDEDEIDEKAVALLSLPDGYQTYCPKSDPSSPSAAFHTFLITRQNGSRLYGSTMLVRHEEEESITAHCLITTIPFVVAARHLLTYFVHKRVDTNLIARICNLKVPSKGKCLKLLLPGYEKDVVVFRGSASYPLLDYPLRELLTNVLSPENVSRALIAAMLEFQIVILAKDYYQLMLVSESLTSLLLPFTWQHVYVPILPARLGLNYLDAPTPYIMGLNVNVFPPSLLSSSLSSLSSHSVQCRIFCQEDRIEFVASDMEEPEILNLMPAFQSQLAQEIDLILRTNVKLTTNVSRKRNKINNLMEQNASKNEILEAASFSYLDDLKLNQLIRMTCMTCLNESLLHDIEKFILPRGNVNNNINNNSSSSSSSGTATFDHVSYLSQQAEENQPFLNKFIETQMFASVIDQKYKILMRRKSSTASIPEQDTLLLKTSAPIDSLHTVDEFLGEVFQGAFDDATIVNLNEPDIAKSCSSPLRQRKVYDLGSRDCLKALPDLRTNNLQAVVQQLESLKNVKSHSQKLPQNPPQLLKAATNSLAIPIIDDKIPSEPHSPSLVPLAAKENTDESAKHQTPTMRDEEREMRAMAALNAHLKVCEAEKEKLRGQIHRLCQENVTLRDELADSQVRVRASSMYTKQLEEDKRHLEFLLSMKKYDDFKSSMGDPYEKKSSFIDSLPSDTTGNRVPVLNNNMNHQIIRLNPKSPVHHQTQPAGVSTMTTTTPPMSGTTAETPTKLKGFQSRMIQYYNKVLTRIND